jgi:hypothetical protein
MKNVKKYVILSAILFASASCSYKDLARTLRYSDNRPVRVDEIRFQELQKMKHGESCGYNLLYAVPIFGDSSIVRAAQNGEVNKVTYIGETGFWTFPFSQTCTVVYGE